MDQLAFVIASRCSGVGTAADGEQAQGAWIIMATDRPLESGASARVGLLARRSRKVRRVVASTLAGEMLALSQGAAELE